MKHIAMLSGGQDSTAMTLRLLELGYPLDYIVFCDTGLEFDEMYEYINKINMFLYRKYDIVIDVAFPRKTFEHWVFGEVTRGENKGIIRGLPLIASPCYWRREAKEIAFNDWIKENNITEYVKYVGYVHHEYDRWKDIDAYNAKAPLVDWKWNEAEVQTYLKDNMMENGLYKHFNRTGCAICPKQGDSLYNLYRYYPEKWEKTKELEKRLYDLRESRGEKQMPGYHTKKFTWELEKEFKQKDKQSTFEFDFEPTQDCFCKI